ncbi:MAG: hypothetical protein ACFB50_10145 [Rubrobacteraceae bacterium]
MLLWLGGSMLIALLVAGTLGAGKAWADDFVVDNDGDATPPAGACTSAPDDCTLRDAITLANGNAASDTITFDLPANSTIVLTSGQLRVQNTAAGPDLTIEGPGADTLAVDGDDNARVFRIASGAEATIEGLTITGGNASLGGGGIFNSGGTLTVNRSAVRGSSAGLGGGIYNGNGTLTVNDSTVSGNSATGDDGGGIANDATLTVNDSTVSGNSASNGGGIANNETVTANRSTISGNNATRGGGIYNGDGTLRVSDSTASGNTAGSFGGGIYNNLGTTIIEYTTITRNSAPQGEGSGVLTRGETLPQR